MVSDVVASGLLSHIPTQRPEKAARFAATSGPGACTLGTAAPARDAEAVFGPSERWPSALSIVMLSQVTHHSAIFPASMRNTAPKSNCALRPEGGKGPIGPRCVPSYVVHAATRFPSATSSLMVWTESGNTAVS